MSWVLKTVFNLKYTLKFTSIEAMLTCTKSNVTLMGEISEC